MPTYTINGKKVKVDRPLSDAEIDEIAADLGASGQIPVDPNLKGPAAPNGPQALDAGERMWRNALAGAAAVPIMGAGARLAAKGLQGGRFAGFGQAAEKALLPQTGGQLVREGVVGAAAGVTAGELGQQTAQKFGEEYRPLGEFGGGMLGGMAANLPFNISKGLMTMGSQAPGTAKEIEEISRLVGGVRAREKVSQAVTANPELLPNLQRAREIQQSTGVDLPTLPASRGDTTIISLQQSQTSRGENAPFIAALANQEKKALEQIKTAARELAIDPKNAEKRMALEAAKAARENVKRETALAQEQARRQAVIEGIDDRILELSGKLSTDAAGKEDITKRLSNLIEAKEKAVKKKLSPQYDVLLQEGRDDGLGFDSKAVKSLYNIVKDNKRAFQDTPLYSKVVRNAKSDEGGFQGWDIDKIDSLKREISAVLSNITDPNKRRMILELNDGFEKALDTLPNKEWVQRYRDLDAQWAKEVGQPFSERGVMMFDRASFVENVFPTLTTKSESLKQIVNAAGDSPEVFRAIEDAFMFKLSTTPSIVKDGVVNPKALDLFIKKNQESISQVPGLEDKLRGVSQTVGALGQRRAQVLEEQKNAAVTYVENMWTKAKGTSGGFRGYVQSALKNPAQLEELMSMAANDKTAQRGLKSAVLDIGLNSPNRVKFFEDNAATIDVLFGKDHSKKVKDLLEASELLREFPYKFKINPGLTQTTGFEQATGQKGFQVAATLRNQVQGWFWKVGTILDRFARNASTKSENEEIQEFLLNRKAVTDASELLEEIKKGNGYTARAAKALSGWVANSASAGIFSGAAGVGLGEAGILERGTVVDRELEYTDEF